MLSDTRRAWARELYDRLPEIYRARDWQLAADRFGDEPIRSGLYVPELEAFLGVVAEEILRLRDHIGDLWDNFFIETCDEWVVPYLADLLGVRLVFNAAARNRAEVKNTVAWRRRKGILEFLAELAASTTGWNVAAAEMFENLGWAQNLNHLKLDHSQAPVLDDFYRISLLGTAADPWLHAADLRKPQSGAGRYGIKTIGLFLSRLNAYPLAGVTPLASGASGERFTFDPLGRDVPLFDARVRQRISAAAYAHEPLAFFGDPSGFAVRQHGILLAAGRRDAGAPTEPAALWSGFGPADAADPAVHLAADGLAVMEPDRFTGPAGHFVVTALWRKDSDGSREELGTLDTGSGAVTISGAAEVPGVLMLSIELAAGVDAARFPASIVRIRNDRAVPRAADSRWSRYRDALYASLPATLLSPGDRLFLYVGEEGTTIYASYAVPHLGAVDVNPPDPFIVGASGVRLDPALAAARALGQAFPTARQAHSLVPSTISNLHRVSGLRLSDEARFTPSRRFVIEARLPASTPGETQLVGRLPTFDDAARGLVAFTYKPQPGVSIPEDATLLLSVSIDALGVDKVFPMTDLVVTARDGEALLVALPEMEFTTLTAPVWLFFDTAGATYYASADRGHDTALGRPERGGALRFDPRETTSGLARQSTGQVFSIPGRVPCQQREPIYANLCLFDHPKPRPPRPGEMAIDPVRGRFLFAAGEDPVAPRAGGPLGIAVDYHEGFSYDVGALTYDRFASLRAPDNPQPTRYVCASGDADQDLPVHATIADAVAHARDGDVIQIEDSATYTQSAPLVIPAVQRLVLQAANRHRPCLRLRAAATVRVAGMMEKLRLNGLLVGGDAGTVDVTPAITIADASLVKNTELIACSVDPVSRPRTLIAGEGANVEPVSQISVCRSVVGTLELGGGVSEAVVADSIVDRRRSVAIAGIAGTRMSGTIHLERVTIWGMADLSRLYASECLLVDHVDVSDRQTGCLRYTRYQLGSTLPRRFRCLPANGSSGADPLTPAFNSRRFGRPDYAQLHEACPSAIRTGAEDGAEVGAFHGALATLAETNLGVKLNEYLPVGLTPALVVVT